MLPGIEPVYDIPVLLRGGLPDGEFSDVGCSRWEAVLPEPLKVGKKVMGVRGAVDESCEMINEGITGGERRRLAGHIPFYEGERTDSGEEQLHREYAVRFMFALWFVCAGDGLEKTSDHGGFVRLGHGVWVGPGAVRANEERVRGEGRG